MLEATMVAKSSGAPKSLLLVHGVCTRPSVFRDWLGSFGTLEVCAVDLQDGLDVAQASMSDYCRRVVTAARSLPRPVVLCGWSVGALVALQAADRADATGVVMLDPSLPGEVRGFHPDIPIRQGLFENEQEYEPFPPEVETRPDSLVARSERQRGIPAPEIKCRSIVLASGGFAPEESQKVADLYRAPFKLFPDLDHFTLVRDQGPRRTVSEFLATLSSE